MHVLAQSSWKNWLSQNCEDRIGQAEVFSNDFKKCRTLDDVKAMERKLREKQKEKVYAKMGHPFYEKQIHPFVKQGQLVLCPGDGDLDLYLPADEMSLKGIEIYPLCVSTLEPLINILACNNCKKPEGETDEALSEKTVVRGVVRGVTIDSLNWAEALDQWSLSETEKKYLLTTLQAAAQQKIWLSFSIDIDTLPEECEEACPDHEKNMCCQWYFATANVLIAYAKK
jgi:hypothetical protein